MHVVHHLHSSQVTQQQVQAVEGLLFVARGQFQNDCGVNGV
jgi:hypothetical protein